MEWDANALNRRFKARAEDHRLYLQQCRQRLRDNPSYERLADETLARYQAHDYFVDRTFLESRHALVAELKRIRDRNYTPSEAFEEERYQRTWHAEIDELIARFSAGGL